jgi:hypothetical protein
MKSHLQRLSKLDEPDEITWLLNYLLFNTAPREVAQVLDKLPDLRPWHDRFVKYWLEWFQKQFPLFQPKNQGVTPA